jgi:23S rRNA U2552 (ribose-2'-O)-methylase RlmE/FtsJ
MYGLDFEAEPVYATSGFPETSWSYVDSDDVLEHNLDASRSALGDLSREFRKEDFLEFRRQVCPEPKGEKLGRGGPKLEEILSRSMWDFYCPSVEEQRREIEQMQLDQAASNARYLARQAKKREESSVSYVVDLGCSPGSMSLEVLKTMTTGTVYGVTNQDIRVPGALFPELKTNQLFQPLLADLLNPECVLSLVNGFGDRTLSETRSNESLVSSAVGTDLGEAGSGGAVNAFRSGVLKAPRLVISDCCMDQDPLSISTARRWEWTNNRLVLSSFVVADRIAGRSTLLVIKMLGFKTHVMQSMLHYASATYDRVSVHKPPLSRAINDEVYLVCAGKKYTKHVLRIRRWWSIASTNALLSGSLSRSWAVFLRGPRCDPGWLDKVSTILNSLAAAQTIAIVRLMGLMKDAHTQPFFAPYFVRKPFRTRHRNDVSTFQSRTHKRLKGKSIPRVPSFPRNDATKKETPTGRPFGQRDYLYATDRARIDVIVDSLIAQGKIPIVGFAKSRREAVKQTLECFGDGAKSGIVYCPAGAHFLLRKELGDEFHSLFPGL